MLCVEYQHTPHLDEMSPDVSTTAHVHRWLSDHAIMTLVAAFREAQTPEGCTATRAKDALRSTPISWPHDHRSRG
jgi:hypothetical protein